MKKFLLKKYVLTILGALVGMVIGYLYWKNVGCATGACPITASPINSTLWGGAMGALLLNMFEPQSPKKQ